MSIEKESMDEIEIDWSLWNVLGWIELKNTPIRSSKSRYNKSISPTRLSVRSLFCFHSMLRSIRKILSFSQKHAGIIKTKKMEKNCFC